MFLASPTINTPELLLLYHELEHAVLLLQRAVQTLLAAQGQFICNFHWEDGNICPYILERCLSYLLTTCMKSSRLLFTTFMLF